MNSLGRADASNKVSSERSGPHHLSFVFLFGWCKMFVLPENPPIPPPSLGRAAVSGEVSRWRDRCPERARLYLERKHPSSWSSQEPAHRALLKIRGSVTVNAGIQTPTTRVDSSVLIL